MSPVQASPEYSENFATPFIEKSGISENHKQVIEVLNKKPKITSEYMIEKRPEGRRPNRISKIFNDSSSVKGSIATQKKGPIVNNSTRLPNKVSFKEQLTSEVSDLKSQLNIPREEFDANNPKTLLSSKKSSFVNTDVKNQQLNGAIEQNRDITAHPVYRAPAVVQELKQLNQEC